MLVHVDQLRELIGEAPAAVSFGTVEEGETSVDFSSVADYGPLVSVSLQPSRVAVRCRVLQPHAGKGEGSWRPLVVGDEVLVAVTAATRGECVVLGRLSNSVDAWPTKVAGQDSTGNAFAFDRLNTPYLFECAGRWLTRESKTGAMLSIDDTGTVTIRDGAGDALQVSADLLAVQSSDGALSLQLDVNGKRATLQAGGALLSLGDSGASALVSPGQLSVSTAGQPAHEHAVSTEAVAGIITQVLIALGSANPGPIIGAALGGLAPVVVSAALPLAAVTPLLPNVAGAVQAGFAATLQKPPGAPGLGQVSPGIGCVGLLLG